MVGGWEWIVIILAIVLLFGARRLPEVGRSLGQGIRAFKKEIRGDADKAAKGSSDKASSDDQDASRPAS